MDPRGQGPLRDNVIAACLVGAVVVVIGYASGLGLRTDLAAANTPAAAAPAQPGVPAVAPPPPLPPAGLLPPPGAPVNAAPPATAAPQITGSQPYPPATSPGPQPPSSTPPHDQDPSEPPPSECQESLLRTLLDMLGLSGVQPVVGSVAPDLPLGGQSDDEDLVDDALDMVAGSCDPDESAPDEEPTAPGESTAPDEEPTEPGESTDPHDGHGGG